MLVFPVDPLSSAGLGVEIGIAGKPPGNERHGLPALPEKAQHRADGVTIPPVLQAHRAPHDAVGTQEIFQLLVHIRNTVRDLPALYVIVLEDVVNGILGRSAVVADGGADPLSHHGGRHIGKRLGERLVVVLLAFSYLLIEPTHITSTSFTRLIPAAYTRRPAASAPHGCRAPRPGPAP